MNKKWGLANIHTGYITAVNLKLLKSQLFDSQFDCENLSSCSLFMRNRCPEFKWAISSSLLFLDRLHQPEFAVWLPISTSLLSLLLEICLVHNASSGDPFLKSSLLIQNDHPAEKLIGCRLVTILVLQYPKWCLSDTLPHIYFFKILKIYCIAIQYNTVSRLSFISKNVL